jgi:hypothetical protein
MKIPFILWMNILKFKKIEFIIYDLHYINITCIYISFLFNC